jgi:hypothetical protein
MAVKNLKERKIPVINEISSEFLDNVEEKP